VPLPLDHLYYWVSDMDRAVRFYEDVVGLFLIRRDGSSWAEFDAGQVRFALHGEVEGRPMVPGGATAVFRCYDLDGARAALEAKGAEFEEHVGEVQGFARFASFRDPDGNVVQLIEYAGETSGGGSPMEERVPPGESEETPPDGRSGA
jgi:predicted enzyme related to lactoylglutathione lyase